MASPSSTDPPLPPVKLDPLAGFLSYLIPGLGQIYQGRVGKGVLFFVGLYLLFFYGMWMGQWQNVWLPDATDLPNVAVASTTLDGVPKAITYRPQFLGQFWIGIAAWPGVLQYASFEKGNDQNDPGKGKPHPAFGQFMQTPSEAKLNELQRNGNKRWDLGWVFTVIAGVLNLLVIYDALAGPMFRDPPRAAGAADADEDWTVAKPQPAAPQAAKAPAPAPAPAPPTAPQAAPTAAPPPEPNQQGGA